LNLVFVSPILRHPAALAHALVGKVSHTKRRAPAPGQRGSAVQSSQAAARMEGVEKALTKLGSFTISRKAKKELSSIGGDISVSARRHSYSPPRLSAQSVFARGNFVGSVAFDLYLVLGKSR
jgi:hypothetical protein